MTNKKIFALLLIFSLSSLFNYTFSQNVLEGTEGKTSIDYTQYGGGVITLNPANKKIELAYINYKVSHRPLAADKSRLHANYSARPYWYGLTVSGKSNNNVSSIFSSGQVNPASEINLKFGSRIMDNTPEQNTNTLERINVIQEQIGNTNDPVELARLRKLRDQVEEEFISGSELWLIARGGYSVSKVNLYDKSLPFGNQFSSKRFDGLQGSLGLNFWDPELFNRKLILLAGMTVGLRKQNNVDELNEVTAKDVTEVLNPATNTTRTFTRDQVGFAGTYQTSTVIPVNFDFYFKPHDLENAAFSFYGRVNSYYGRSSDPMKNGRQHPTNLGLGFYLLNENWLAHPVGGVTVELKDSFQTLSTDKFTDRIVFNLVTRVNIAKINRD